MCVCVCVYHLKGTGYISRFSTIFTMEVIFMTSSLNIIFYCVRALKNLNIVPNHTILISINAAYKLRKLYRNLRPLVQTRLWYVQCFQLQTPRVSVCGPNDLLYLFIISVLHFYITERHTKSDYVFFLPLKTLL